MLTVLRIIYRFLRQAIHVCVYVNAGILNGFVPIKKSFSFVFLRLSFVQLNRTTIEVDRFNEIAYLHTAYTINSQYCAGNLPKY